MVKVLDALREEHRNFSRVLEILAHQIALFEKAEEPDYDLAEKIIEYLINFPDLSHHPKEDLLYQKLRLRDQRIADIMGDLETEHQKLAELTTAFEANLKNVLLDAEQPRAEFIDAAKEFIDFFRSHIMLEELRFFPAALRALSAADWREIEDSLAQSDDPIFGDNIAVPYIDLRDQIYEIATEQQI
ncbi:MAG: hemerythrin domain-containing protein [Rhodospirillaceae bacterium]|nr:hemerythrin domain-containing protein [Rhodospirillaceae bacterium]MBT4940984.1 hemerythrin domain-containing protein [Rhodospirillaceae bacterium]MBT5938880.1 hemerythrin domain-containing protein [Rhodospirillaceae bacterium]MBT7954003.1 hemerythrin domain-containing protein [Rhodospirillaceae bacterium]